MLRGNPLHELHVQAFLSFVAASPTAICSPAGTGIGADPPLCQRRSGAISPSLLKPLRSVFHRVRGRLNSFAWSKLLSSWQGTRGRVLGSGYLGFRAPGAADYVLASSKVVKFAQVTQNLVN